MQRLADDTVVRPPQVATPQDRGNVALQEHIKDRVAMVMQQGTKYVEARSPEIKEVFHGKSTQQKLQDFLFDNPDVLVAVGVGLIAGFYLFSH